MKVASVALFSSDGYKKKLKICLGIVSNYNNSKTLPSASNF